MNKQHSPPDDPHSRAAVNRAASRLRVYQLERLSNTDAANITRPPRKPLRQRLRRIYALWHLIR
ncbi:MAG TPA: hypothetical protein VN873_19660 [Candidatus Angelobacter sp.]|nr:hypothetical protein [Candidatus Angelobacter sp.]